MTTNRQLIAIAERGLRAEHRYWWNTMQGVPFTEKDGHLYRDFENCPHPDCRCVRQALTALSFERVKWWAVWCSGWIGGVVSAAVSVALLYSWFRL